MFFYSEDFWLGLEKIHSIAQQGDYTLRIDMEDWKEEKHWAEYQFSLGGPSEYYTLHVSNFSGDILDALTNMTGVRFSTKEGTTDKTRNADCTRSYTGNCSFSLCFYCRKYLGNKTKTNNWLCLSYMHIVLILWQEVGGLMDVGRPTSTDGLLGWEQRAVLQEGGASTGDLVQGLHTL